MSPTGAGRFVRGLPLRTSGNRRSARLGFSPPSWSTRPNDSVTRLIEVDNLHVAYGQRRALSVAIESITLEVTAGELVCLVGPSGCGKTTLLRCLAGLQRPTRGTVRFKGEDVVRPPAGMAVVFQDYARSLYPWLSVHDNVLLPLRRQRRGHREEIEKRVASSLAAVGLAEVGGRYPRQLSGGMQQRVAIARAIAYRPSVLLMDEPFASVDAQSRATLEDLVRALWRELSLTIVFVTHDIDEAVYMASRVVVLSDPPTRVREIVEVGLGPERDQVKTKALPAFAELRGQIFSEIMGYQADIGGS
jgi:NitT/TauT family transport system ATP-binding protein